MQTVNGKEPERTMDQFCQDHAPAALNSCESLQETEFLLRSPNNARRLMRAIEADKKGLGRCMTVDELEK